MNIYRLIFIISLILGLSSNSYAQICENQTSNEVPVAKHRVYALLKGYGTNFFDSNKNVNITIDLGQYQSTSKSYMLMDENGKAIKFKSVVDALDYMGERGWILQQVYTENEKNCWLMYKDITKDEDKYEGLLIQHTDSDSKK